jgi:hypothetical protein
VVVAGHDGTLASSTVNAVIALTFTQESKADRFEHFDDADARRH